VAPHALGAADAVLGILGFIVLWVLISLSLYIASRLTGVRTSFGSAMVTSLLAAIAFFLVDMIFSLIGLHAIGVLLGIIAVLFVIKSRERIGWLHALGISVLTIIILVIVLAVLGFLFGLSLFAALRLL
jgi:small-conductance mechanosensitive channel